MKCGAPANTVVHPQNVTPWVEAILVYPLNSSRESKDAIFALSQMAQVSGDRARDLPDSLREQVVERLLALGADEATVRPVREYHEVERSQQNQALGDALPVGLRLRVDPSDGPTE